MSGGYRTVPSPNFDERPFAPDMVVLHYTDMADVEAAIAWLAAPESRVSAHYVITAAGEIVAMVDEAKRAWHAGVSYWDGSRDINARAIGIELDSPGHRPLAPEFPEPQLAALLDLLAEIRGRWPIPPRGVVGHSDVAPMRKIDPGERFVWSRLAAAGHALVAHAGGSEAEDGGAPEDLFAVMHRAGYGLPADAAEAAALVRAFHRRHRPDAVDAPADAMTGRLAEAFAAAVEADRQAHPDRRMALGPAPAEGAVSGA